MSEAQDGRCAICKLEKKLYLDHDHQTDEPRGMLCSSCNTALGKFRDDPIILMSAINYLVSGVS
jgi:hypothetical protein